MGILKIYQYPDKVLAQKAKAIDRVEKSLRKVADDMFETMYHAPGIGLAANQVGMLQRFVVIDVDYELQEIPPGVPAPPQGEVIEGSLVVNKKPIILVNPKIIHREGEILYCEGCLSVPEYSAEVKRAEKIKVEYQDIDGLSKTLSAEGLLAVCIQHELDHLDGKLFIDRLGTAKRDLARKKVIKFRKEQEE